MSKDTGDFIISKSMSLRLPPIFGYNYLVFVYSPTSPVFAEPVTYLCIYIWVCLWTKFFFKLYYSDRLTFSNIHGRTSHRIVLALPLLSPEMLSSSKDFLIIMRTLLYLSGWMIQLPAQTHR